MVFKKEKSRRTNSNGRPSKDPEDTFAAKTQEEKQTYWREKKLHDTVETLDTCWTTKNS